VPPEEELSGIGVAYAAGIAVGLYDLEKVFSGIHHQTFVPKLEKGERDQKYSGWKNAVGKVLTK
jgi:glycerol kinase